MSVVIRRKVTSTKSFTVIVFDKDHTHQWPTNDHEHAEIEKIFMQDKPYDGIINDYTRYKKLLE
tara:strand:+ start:349 stop:540 length:192 start_codon:yes stop_codon:yes gene_type:complete